MNDSDAAHDTDVRQDEEFVCSVADALQEGDEVRINGRSRPLTVLGREVESNPGVTRSTEYPYRIVWARGNGTEYRLRYSHTGDYYPGMHTESELEVRESFSIRDGEPVEELFATSRSETVRSIDVVGVDEEDMNDWILSRLMFERSEVEP